MKFLEVGNLKNGISGFEKRKVVPRGLITTPSLVLKYYEMYSNSEGPINQQIIKDGGKFIEHLVTSGQISPEIGMGFAILSEDMLNIVRWDSQYGYVLKNTLYSHTEGSIPRFKENGRLNLAQMGSFCAFELAIVDHERKAWMAYLNSNRTEDRKEKYVQSVFHGEI